MKVVIQSLGTVVLGIGLLGLTSGCGKKLVRGSSGSDQRVARAALKDSTGMKRPRLSLSLPGGKQTGLSQEIDLKPSQAGMGDKVEITSTDIHDQKSRFGEGRHTDISKETPNRSMLTTPSSKSSSRFDASLGFTRRPSSESYEQNNGKYDFPGSDGGVENAALSQKDHRKGVTFSNGLHDIYFEFDSWRLNEQSRQTLEANAEWLKAHPHERISIEGHCDERGTQAYNYVLGEKRATMVQQYLSFLGVPHHQLVITSFGKDRPECRGFSESCFQKNRRAHFESDLNVAAQ